MKLILVYLIFIVFVSTENENENEKKCGKRDNSMETSFGGEKYPKNAWPWLVAFIYWQSEKFFCGGSVISQKHVLSGDKKFNVIKMKFYSFFLAAHCFQNKGQQHKISERFVRALLGKHDLSFLDELGAKSCSILEIIIHPDWDFNEEKFDADISLVVLTQSFEFNTQIQPVCLPEKSYNEFLEIGIVAGWGKSEGSGNAAMTPSQLSVPSVNASHCFTTFPKLATFASNRAFCGGYVNQQKAPCLGDSGGGFYLRDSSIWKIKGIVSGSLFSEEYGCDINKYSLYTNVGWFTEWIEEKMMETMEVEWESVEFQCKETR